MILFAASKHAREVFGKLCALQKLMLSSLKLISEYIDMKTPGLDFYENCIYACIRFM
jgi:hypothetical protein